MKTIKKIFATLCFTALTLFLTSFETLTLAAKLASNDIPVGTNLFPYDNIWNAPVDSAAIHPNSAQWMDVINGHAGHPLKFDFGSVYLGHVNGIPYNIVGNATPKVIVRFNPVLSYASESDPLPPEGLPIPPDAVAEGDPPPVDLTGDRHLLLLDTDNKVLHELFAVLRQPDGSWICAQYTRWDITSNNLRTNQFTSADAAGLPILPGLVRWDEIQSGEIKHALRFTLAMTWKPHTWPARHDAPSGSPINPPMGMRVRLKANFDISHYSATNQVILKALKKYGMFLADNGGDWYVSGAPNANFIDDDLHLVVQIIPHNAFEVVDTSTWMINPNSAACHPIDAAVSSLIGSGLSAVKVYPDPWRSDKHYARQITFSNLPDSATVRVFTVSGHLVKTLPSVSGPLQTWDLTTHSGDDVASGIYLYTVEIPSGQSTHGKLAIIK